MGNYSDGGGIEEDKPTNQIVFDEGEQIKVIKTIDPSIKLIVYDYKGKKYIMEVVVEYDEDGIVDKDLLYPLQYAQIWNGKN
jgi:hypothetical protein